MSFYKRASRGVPEAPEAHQLETRLTPQGPYRVGVLPLKKFATRIPKPF